MVVRTILRTSVQSMRAATLTLDAVEGKIKQYPGQSVASPVVNDHLKCFSDIFIVSAIK